MCKGKRASRPMPLPLFFRCREISDLSMKGRTGMCYRDAKSLISGIPLEDFFEAERGFFAVAVEIRRKMGNRAYLLNSFISIAFSCLNAKSISEIGDEGFSVFDNLIENSRHAIEGDDDLVDPVFLQQFKEYKKRHQEDHTAACMTRFMLSQDALKPAMNNFIGRLSHCIDSTVDSLLLKDLYEKITEAVGESLMDRLIDCFERRFLVVPSMNAFLQGFTDSYLHALLFRDAETNKQVFQLILDGMERAGT